MLSLIKRIASFSQKDPGKSGTKTMEGRKPKSIIVTMGSRLYSQYLFLSKIRRSGCREVLELMTFGPSISRFHNLAVATLAGTPGMHSDKRKCGEESAKRGLMRLQETWRSARVFLRRNWIRSDSFANFDRVPRMGWTVASRWDPFKFLVLS